MNLALNLIKFEIQLLELLQMVFQVKSNRSQQSKPCLVGEFSEIGNPYPQEAIEELHSVFQVKSNRSRQSKPYLASGFKDIGNPYPKAEIDDNKPVRGAGGAERAQQNASGLADLATPYNERPDKPVRNDGDHRKPSADDGETHCE
jgi:hypothetical protein